MGSFKVECSIFIRELERYKLGLKNLPKDLAKVLLQDANDTFVNNDWEAKKDGTRATLIKSGTLKRGLKSKYNTSSSTIYNNTNYASYHQLGTIKMVARKFIIDDREIVVDEVKKLVRVIFKR